MEIPGWARQDDYDRRLEWGPPAAGGLSEGYAVIVDVLRFSTAVEAATSRGAAVYPYRWRDDSAEAFARTVGATLAGSDPTGPSLSPATLLRLTGDDAVVLPSPNGSTCAALAVEAGATPIAGCLRNAPAIADYLRDAGRPGPEPGPVTVIPCGERWPDGSLRPCVEDYLGAGAVLSHLGGRPSPEARVAIAAWEHSRGDIEDILLHSASGKELVSKGLVEDVRYASRYGASNAVPILRRGAFVLH